MAQTAAPIVSASQAPERVPHSVFIALGVSSACVLSILYPEAIPHDSEELYNAAHARLMQLGHWNGWLDMQYRGHCGGCTQNALIGAGLFKMFGPSLGVWKMIAVLFNGLLAYAGAALIHRSVGLFGATVFGALLILAPPTFLELSLTSWGNHFEAGVGAVAVLSAAHWLLQKPSAWRAIFLGAVLAIALWTGFSAAFIGLGLVAALLRRVSWKTAGMIGVIGSSVGLLWWYQSHHAMSGPFETIYYPGESLPSVARVPAKLWTLIAPRQLVALFGLPQIPGGWALAWATTAAIAIAAWVGRKNSAMPMTLKFLGAFLVVYSTVRFTVWAPPAPEIAPPGSMRYAAPIYGLSFIVLALGAGTLWISERRIQALLILVPSITVGFIAKSAHFSPPFPDKTVFAMSAADFEYSRDQLSYLLPLSEHQACQRTEADAVAFHQFGIAWARTRQVLDDNPTATIDLPTNTHFAALEGIAAALLSEVDSDEDRGITTLESIDLRIPKAGDQVRFEVLAAAAWRRNWLPGLPEYGPTRISSFIGYIGHLPMIYQEALAHSLGRKWARDMLRWRQPTTFEVPSVVALSPPLDDRFISGLAEGLSERWGPGPHPVSGVTPANQTAWDTGVTRGLSRRWFNQSR